MRLFKRLACKAIGHEPIYYQARVMTMAAGVGKTATAARAAIHPTPWKFIRRVFSTFPRGSTSAPTHSGFL